MLNVNALAFAVAHFAHLDRSNAAIHMATVRYSPITFALAELYVALRPEEADDAIVADVLAHRGTYPLDHGR
jgi:hypothetical protein